MPAPDLVGQKLLLAGIAHTVLPLRPLGVRISGVQPQQPQIITGDTSAADGNF